MNGVCVCVSASIFFVLPLSSSSTCSCPLYLCHPSLFFFFFLLHPSLVALSLSFSPFVPRALLLLPSRRPAPPPPSLPPSATPSCAGWASISPSSAMTGPWQLSGSRRAPGLWLQVGGEGGREGGTDGRTLPVAASRPSRTLVPWARGSKPARPGSCPLDPTP